MTYGLFITGTDTGVGKTEVAAAICALYTKYGVTVHPHKPVESGCSDLNAPTDALTLKLASECRDSLDIISPYRFIQPLSPELAAKLSGKKLSLDMLINSCQLSTTHITDINIAEGAGGIYSPIAEDALNIDLALSLQLPVVLVGEDRLGGVNQILLARRAILESGLTLAAIVLNRSNGDKFGNIESLKRRVLEPLITINEVSISPNEGRNSEPWHYIREQLTELSPLPFPLLDSH